uniref:Uncharacterized protein n=1 Tax=Astatotilapia calliptera TaxID=8154 RepID=A0A3P8Q3I2_ASTCA
MSGSMSSRGPGGKSALFKSPTFSSNSEANTEEGRLMEVVPLWQARGHAVALSHLQPEGPFDSCGRGERSQPSSCQ